MTKRVKLLEEAIKLGLMLAFNKRSVGLLLNRNLFTVNVFASISHPKTETRLLTLLFDGISISKFILHIII